MKNISPKANVEWMQLFLFPFKVCIVLIPAAFIFLVLETGTAHVDRMPISDEITNLMVVGDIVCIIILAIGGIFTAILMRNWRLMLPGLIYAVIGFFLFCMFLLPMLAATK
jgi:hypothetical protein